MKTRNYLVQKNTGMAWMLLGPLMIYFLVFSGFPTAFALVLGFVKWVGITAPPVFSGLANFKQLFSEKMYLTALWNSFFIGGLLMCVNMIVGFLGAYFMNMDIKGRVLFRSLWFVPVVTAYIATAQIFMLFINPSAGVANTILKGIGLNPVIWSSSTGWMIFWIVFYGAWKNIGGCMIIWLAGLQSIDRSIYEQASIDGTSWWQMMWRITLPLLRPISVFVLISQFRDAIQIFDSVFFISKGGPYGTTDVMVYRVLLDFYQDQNFGMAGAGALVITLVIAVFSLFIMRWYTGKGRTYA
jgi:multiple sugar transport system permease protein